MFNKSKARGLFLTRKTEGVCSILIEKHLRRDEGKFVENVHLPVLLVLRLLLEKT